MQFCAAYFIVGVDVGPGLRVRFQAEGMALRQTVCRGFGFIEVPLWGPTGVSRSQETAIPPRATMGP